MLDVVGRMGLCEDMAFAACALESLPPRGRYRGLERHPGKLYDRRTLSQDMLMINDPIGDLLTRIKNAAQNRGLEIWAPYSKMREGVLSVMKEEGYLADYKKEGNKLQIVLAFAHRRPIISGVKNVSKPGLRIYRKSDKLPKPLGGIGISIVSTSRGIMSNIKAKREGLGGEILGMVW